MTPKDCKPKTWYAVLGYPHWKFYYFYPLEEYSLSWRCIIFCETEDMSQYITYRTIVLHYDDWISTNINQSKFTPEVQNAIQEIKAELL